MTRKTKKQTVVQELDVQPTAPSEILSINDVTPEPLNVTKEQLEKIMGKFPEYPNLSNRHPEAIEGFIYTYNQTLQEAKQAIQQIS